MKRFLVTGGAGFIGSHFVELLLSMGCKVLNLDNLSYAADLKFLESLERDCNHKFVEGDIRDHNLISDLLRDYKPEAIINFAAQSHVDRSIDNPDIFVQSNIVGAHNLLECAREYYSLRHGGISHCFLQVSTDEVYGVRSKSNPAFENSHLRPTNVYSATKASSDLLALSYFHTYRMPVRITRCCNNYGPRQHSEKLIPKIISSLIERTNIPIYGTGEQIRQWINVKDHVQILLGVVTQGIDGEIYNVGDDNFIANIDLAKSICEIYDRVTGAVESKKLIEHVDDRIGHDISYNINYDRVRTLLSIDPAMKMQPALERLVVDQCKFSESKA